MRLAPVPGVEDVGEAIIGEARDRTHDRVAEERRQPVLAGSDAPDRDRNIGTDDEAAGFVGGMQATAHVLERRAMTGERLRIKIDVAKFDRSGLDRGNELVALAIDAGVANGAARVVPDHEALRRRAGRSSVHRSSPNQHTNENGANDPYQDTHVGRHLGKVALESMEPSVAGRALLVMAGLAAKRPALAGAVRNLRRV
jgi:hypothetical protein